MVLPLTFHWKCPWDTKHLMVPHGHSPFRANSFCKWELETGLMFTVEHLSFTVCWWEGRKVHQPRLKKLRSKRTATEQTDWTKKQAHILARGGWQMRSLISWLTNHKHDQSWSKYSITVLKFGFWGSPKFLLPHWNTSCTFLRCTIFINKTRTTGAEGVLQLQEGLFMHEALCSHPCAAQASHNGVCL